MSILDTATNDALNRIIDLHQESVRAEGSVCGHCSGLPGAIPVVYPCPTIAALTAAAETTLPEHQHQFAAYNGYCVGCGADGWTPEQRKSRGR